MGSDRRPRPMVALCWYEEAMALASFAEGQGFAQDAAVMREFADTLRPYFASLRRPERRRAS